MHACTHTHTQTYVYTHARMRAYIHTYIQYTHTHAHAFSLTHKHTHTNIHIHPYSHAHTQVAETTRAMDSLFALGDMRQLRDSQDASGSIQVVRPQCLVPPPPTRAEDVHDIVSTLPLFCINTFTKACTYCNGMYICTHRQRDRAREEAHTNVHEPYISIISILYATMNTQLVQFLHIQWLCASCACTHTRAHTHTHKQSHITHRNKHTSIQQTRTRTHVHTRKHTHTHIPVTCCNFMAASSLTDTASIRYDIYTHTNTHTHTHTHTRQRKYTHTHAHTHTRTCDFLHLYSGTQLARNRIDSR